MTGNVADVMAHEPAVARSVEDVECPSVRALTPGELFAELEARGVCYEEVDW